MAVGELQIYRINVTLNTNPPEPVVELSGNDLVNGEIRIQQGMAMIVFVLESPQTGVQFPTYPIEWLETDGVQDTAQPGSFLVQRLGADRCLVVDFNAAPGPDVVRHKFNVLVTFSGSTYGSDPTIINDPPGGGS